MKKIGAPDGKRTKLVILRENLEDRADLRIAGERLSKPFVTLSKDQVWRELRLGDEK